MADFTTTIFSSDGSRLTDYLCPINWILSSGSGKDSVMIVINPFEAHELLPIIHEKKKVWLHIYALWVSSSICSFSNLTFYSIPYLLADTWSAPTHARIELNLFTGQLYFDSKEEYKRVCGLLALSRVHPGVTYSKVDRFVPTQYRTGHQQKSTFLIPSYSILLHLIPLILGVRRE